MSKFVISYKTTDKKKTFFLKEVNMDLLALYHRTPNVTGLGGLSRTRPESGLPEVLI